MKGRRTSQEPEMLVEESRSMKSRDLEPKITAPEVGNNQTCENVLWNCVFVKVMHSE